MYHPAIPLGGEQWLKNNDWCITCLSLTGRDWIICLFGLGFYMYVPVNSYGHVEIVNSHNHTFFFGKYFVHRDDTFTCN